MGDRALASTQIFLVLAGLCFLIGGFGLLKPKVIFGSTYSKPEAQHLNFIDDIRRLAKHKGIYPVIMMNFMFNFAPGAATPLQFYLTDRLHLPDWVYSSYNAIFVGAFVPTLLLYGLLCKKIVLRKLLLWGTIIAVPQMVPLLFVHSALTAQIMALFIGLLGGVVVGAMADVTFRACPPGLQGSLMMIVAGVLSLSSRGSDLLGTYIYARGGSNGFLYCVIAITIVYALIIPVLFWIPRHLTSTTDGQANPEIQAEIREELSITQ